MNLIIDRNEFEEDVKNRSSEEMEMMMDTTQGVLVDAIMRDNMAEFKEKIYPALWDEMVPLAMDIINENAFNLNVQLYDFIKKTIEQDQVSPVQPVEERPEISDICKEHNLPNINIPEKENKEPEPVLELCNDLQGDDVDMEEIIDYGITAMKDFDKFEDIDEGTFRDDLLDNILSLKGFIGKKLYNELDKRLIMALLTSIARGNAEMAGTFMDSIYDLPASLKESVNGAISAMEKLKHDIVLNKELRTDHDLGSADVDKVITDALTNAGESISHPEISIDYLTNNDAFKEAIVLECMDRDLWNTIHKDLSTLYSEVETETIKIKKTVDKVLKLFFNNEVEIFKR